MTRKQAEKHKDVIIAFLNGEEIEFYNLSGEWKSTITPEFSDFTPYRVKPKPKYVPFTIDDQHLFRDKWLMRKGENREYLKRVIAVHKQYVYLGNISSSVSYDVLLEMWEFEDGAPCGKLVS